MGFAEFPLGTTLLGMDGQVTTNLTTPRKPAAAKFDGTKLDYVEDSTGQLVEEHPIDAGMFFVCRVAAGSIRSAEGVGNQLRNSKYLERNMQSFVDDKVSLATQAYTSTGEVTLLGNVIEQSRGRLMVQVNYRNNVTGQEKAARV